MSRYYILEGRKAVEADDFRVWAKWMDGAVRKVAETMVGKARVSTVFLGLDHNWMPGASPVLFETLVFGGPADGEMMRYSTWDEAEIGHQVMVECAKRYRRSPKAQLIHLRRVLRDKIADLRSRFRKAVAR